MSENLLVFVTVLMEQHYRFTAEICCQKTDQAIAVSEEKSNQQTSMVSGF